MDDRIVRFVAALRAAGVRVSMAESQDALAATQAVGVMDRESFRLALRTTLVKDRSNLDPFESLFPLYFGQGQRPMSEAEQELSPEQIEQLRQALQGMAEELREMLQRLLEGKHFSQEELRRAAEQAGLNEASRFDDRHWLARRMARQLGLAEALAEIEALLAQLAAMGMSPEAVEQIRGLLGTNLEKLEEEVQHHAGISLAERLAEWKKENAGSPPLMDIPFQNLSPREADDLRHEVTRLAARLRTRAALRQKRGKGRRLDPKGTLRANLRHGNVPFVLVHRVRRKKARFTLICDVSTSMRPVVSFLLLLMYQMQAQVGRTRTFAFIDHLEEVGQLFDGRRPEEAVPEVLHRLPPGHYNTDLGGSLHDFCRDQMGAIDSRTTLIVCGDGRNNFNDPRTDLVEQLARKAKKVVWLNPEPTALWGTGDSDMLMYAPLVDSVFQVANLRQLSEAIDQLMV